MKRIYVKDICHRHIVILEGNIAHNGHLSLITCVHELERDLIVMSSVGITSTCDFTGLEVGTVPTSEKITEKVCMKILHKPINLQNKSCHILNLPTPRISVIHKLGFRKDWTDLSVEIYFQNFRQNGEKYTLSKLPWVYPVCACPSVQN